MEWTVVSKNKKTGEVKKEVCKSRAHAEDRRREILGNLVGDGYTYDDTDLWDIYIEKNESAPKKFSCSMQKKKEALAKKACESTDPKQVEKYRMDIIKTIGKCRDYEDFLAFKDYCLGNIDAWRDGYGPLIDRNTDPNFRIATEDIFAKSQLKEQAPEKKAEALSLDDLYAQEEDLRNQLKEKCKNPTIQVRSPEAFLDRWGLYEHNTLAINSALDAAEEQPTNVTGDLFYEIYKDRLYEDSHDEKSEISILNACIRTLKDMLKAKDTAVFNYVII